MIFIKQKIIIMKTIPITRPFNNEPRPFDSDSPFYEVYVVTSPFYSPF